MSKPATVQKVLPVTFLLGSTEVSRNGLEAYLEYTGQQAFLDAWDAAMATGLNSGLALCSVYAKMCYSALTPDKNENISRVRDIPDNLVGTMRSAHGSVFEHCWLNFVTTDCSRVFTHEHVRHRVGTAFSQTSGRYVRSDVLRFVEDPILAPVADLGTELLVHIQDIYGQMVERSGLRDPGMPFDQKKKITSALRRYLPNGQANEMGWSANLRTLRHWIMLRTARHAEWEIRYIGNQVYRIMKDMFPLMFHDAVETPVDGLPEITGMRLQPYELIKE